MVKEDKSDSKYVKKETMLVVALVAVVAGFLGGVLFSAFKSGSSQPPPSVAQPVAQQAEQSAALSAQQANIILNLEKEVAVNPDNLQAWTQLGDIYFDTGQHEKAIRVYNRSLELKPDDPNVLTDLGVMYRLNGQPELAIASFDKAMALDPRHEQSRFNKGVVLLNDLQDRAGAVKAWEELLQINPSAVAPNGVLIGEAIKKL